MFTQIGQYTAGRNAGASSPLDLYEQADLLLSRINELRLGQNIQKKFKGKKVSFKAIPKGGSLGAAAFTIKINQYRLKYLVDYQMKSEITIPSNILPALSLHHTDMLITSKVTRRIVENDAISEAIARFKDKREKFYVIVLDEMIRIFESILILKDQVRGKGAGIRIVVPIVYEGSVNNTKKLSEYMSASLSQDFSFEEDYMFRFEDILTFSNSLAAQKNLVGGFVLCTRTDLHSSLFFANCSWENIELIGNSQPIQLSEETFATFRKGSLANGKSTENLTQASTCVDVSEAPAMEVETEDSATSELFMIRQEEVYFASNFEEKPEPSEYGEPFDFPSLLASTQQEDTQTSKDSSPAFRDQEYYQKFIEFYKTATSMEIPLPAFEPPTSPVSGDPSHALLLSVLKPETLLDLSDPSTLSISQVTPSSTKVNLNAPFDEDIIYTPFAKNIMVAHARLNIKNSNGVYSMKATPLKGEYIVKSRALGCLRAEFSERGLDMQLGNGELQHESGIVIKKVDDKLIIEGKFCPEFFRIRKMLYEIEKE